MSKNFTSRWANESAGGRINLSLSDSGRVEMTWSGSAPPGKFLPAIVCKLIGHYGYERSGRVEPFKVRERVGMSGCIDYILETWSKQQKSEKWFARGRAKVHVSMYGTLNEGLDLWFGDLVEIMELKWENWREVDGWDEKKWPQTTGWFEVSGEKPDDLIDPNPVEAQIPDPVTEERLIDRPMRVIIRKTIEHFDPIETFKSEV